MKSTLKPLMAACFTVFALAACNSGSQESATAAGPAAGTPSGRTGGSNGGSGGSSGSGGTTAAGVIGPSCVSSDANQICIGVKAVSYTSNGQPTYTEDQAVATIQGINDLWKQCNVAFQLEEYQAVNPADYGLTNGSDSQGEAGTVRSDFSDDKTFLLAATGSWNSSYIAWTQMPGAGPYGSVFDVNYATDAITVAHEFGHYLGLDHVSDQGNIMYPQVYPNDTAFTSDQCSLARSTAASYWQAMMRH